MKESKVVLDRIRENDVEAEEELCDGCGSELSAAGDDCISQGWLGSGPVGRRAGPPESSVVILDRELGPRPKK